MMQPIATVVIVSHERPALRKAALESVLDSVAGARVCIPVVVIDSSRQPDPVPEGVTLIHDPQRPSCVAKRRLAFDMAESEWLIFLDDDCRVTPQGVGVMLEEIEAKRQSRTAALFVVTEFVGDRTVWFEAALRSDLMAGFDYANFGGDLMWGTTSLSAFRCSAIREVRAFDAVEIPLPAGGEDVDACLRLRCAGWRLCGIPKTLALHSTETWNSFTKNGRRSRHYGAAEAELVRLYSRQSRAGWENVAVSLLLGALVARLASGSTHLSPTLLLLAAFAGWCAGEVQELHSRHGDAAASHLGIQLAWSALYELGRIEAAIRRRRPALALRRFDWEAAEPSVRAMSLPRGIPTRLYVSGVVAAGVAALLNAVRRT